MVLQPGQPLLRILYLSNTRVGVFPERKEFIVMLDGFAFPTLLFIQFCKTIIIDRGSQQPVVAVWVKGN